MIVTFREIRVKSAFTGKTSDYKNSSERCLVSQSMMDQSLNNAMIPRANEALYEAINTFWENGTELEYTPGIKILLSGLTQLRILEFL